MLLRERVGHPPWDYDNRLTSVTLPGTGGTLAFKYDALHHRVQKVFTQGSTTTTTNYLYDGDNAVADLDQNGNILARYTATQDIDKPLAELRSGTTSYYSQDGLGSVTSLTTAAGTLGNTYRYDSFGNVTASSGSISNRFEYTAREFDSETGLNYYRARYYDPNTGRFLSEDPVRFSSNQFDFYSYVSNNSLRFSDPFGLCLLQFDSVTSYHLKCQQMPSQKDLCACHAVYIPNDVYQEFIDSCMACGKKDATPRDACLCTCNLLKKFIPERINQTCETFCKVANP
jgi:RHS repeat-associated protein